jgi:hypothetical protein
VSEPCREIRIVTGPGGRVQGSKVYLDGQELPELSYVEIKGAVGEQWEIETIRVLLPVKDVPVFRDPSIDMGEDNV